MSAAKRAAYFVGLPILLVVMWWALTLGPTNFYVPTPQKLGETFVKVWGGERFRTADERNRIERPHAIKHAGEQVGQERRNQ